MNPLLLKRPSAALAAGVLASAAGLAGCGGGGADAAVSEDARLPAETLPVANLAGDTEARTAGKKKAVVDVPQLTPREQSAYDAVRDFDSLARYSEVLAETPFRPAPELPPDLQDLSYDDYRLISFFPNEAYWRRDGTPFQLETFHRGYIFFERVRIHLLEEQPGGGVDSDEVMLAAGRYEYRGRMATGLDIPPATGHAGLKINGTLPGSIYMQELMSFLGASYFRNLSEGQVYGTSSRGLGVDMGMNKMEEFPCFRDFWVFKPESRDEDQDGEFDGPPGTGELHFLASLDSPSMTGAYEFRLRPGHASEVDVRARLFFRHRPQKLCLAPMSSMWMWGDGRQPPEGDARPKVHDADGLLTRGESPDGDGWTFRPLAKQEYPSVSSFRFDEMRGFGLLQRDRDYDHYRDDEAKYHQRPSVWIEPLDEAGEAGSWGGGHVELFEMPADHEGYDNIACWFVPDAEFGPGEPYDMRYRVSHPSGDVAAHETGRAVATRVSRGGGLTTVEIDFEGIETADESSQSAGSLTARVSAGAGSVEELTLTPATTAGDHQGSVTLRMRFRRPETAAENAPTELRAQLLAGETPVAETWRYLCPPR